MTTTATSPLSSPSCCCSTSFSPSSSANTHRRRIRVSLPPPIAAGRPVSIHPGRRRRSFISCEVAINASAAESELLDQEEDLSKVKIGARVRVKVPNLKVYHVPKVPEIDISGMEGELKQYVALWKGKRISANFPFKVQFFTEVQGRGRLKFLVHLKEDEFEYIIPSNSEQQQ